jgi:hypothetical protein
MLRALLVLLGLVHGVTITHSIMFVAVPAHLQARRLGRNDAAQRLLHALPPRARLPRAPEQPAALRLHAGQALFPQLRQQEGGLIAEIQTLQALTRSRGRRAGGHTFSLYSVAPGVIFTEARCLGWRSDFMPRRPRGQPQPVCADQSWRSQLRAVGLEYGADLSLNPKRRRATGRASRSQGRVNVMFNVIQGLDDLQEDRSHSNKAQFRFSRLGFF